MDIQLSSDAFNNGGPIPKKYSCDGEKISPPLSWTGIPPNTKSIVLIMDDPDAPSGTFVHWVLFNLGADESKLPEGFSPSENLSGKYIEGKNSFGRNGYGPPCPPKGSTHRYFFRIYALSEALELPANSSRQKVEQSMHGKILATGQLMGTYGR